MRKLILGIIAVVFLQIAFFAYLAYDGRVDESAHVARNVPQDTQPFINKVPTTAPESPAAPATSEPAKSKEARTPRLKTASLKSNSGYRSSGNRDVVNDELPEAERSRPTRFRRQYVSARPTRMVPAGHTLVLVDYLPAKAEAKPRMFVPRCATTQYASIYKKRSFLSRTASVIKKPWKWMRSAASKLN